MLLAASCLGAAHPTAVEVELDQTRRRYLATAYHGGDAVRYAQIADDRAGSAALRTQLQAMHTHLKGAFTYHAQQQHKSGHNNRSTTAARRVAGDAAGCYLPPAPPAAATTGATPMSRQYLSMW